MGTITVQNLTTLGLVATFTAASSGLSDEFSNNGHTFIYVKNSVAATNSAIITSRVTPVPKGLVAVNVTVEVSASGERMSGFFDQGAYNDSSGNVTITWATHTGLTVAAISVT